MLKTFIFLIFFLFTLSGWADQSSNKVLTLREAILLSLRYNPDVKNAEIGRVVDKFNLKLAQWEFEVQYSLAGTWNETFNRTSGVYSRTRTYSVTPGATLNGLHGTQYALTMNNPVTTFGVYNPGIDLSLTQPLLRGFGEDVATASLYSAVESEEASKLNLRGTMIATIVSVIQAYRQLVVDQNNVNINKMSLKDYEYTINMDEALIKAGKMAPTEVLQAKADYAQAQVTLESSITSVINDKYQLLSVLGLSPDTPVNVPYEIELCKADVPSLEKIYEIALMYDIAYLTAKLQVKVDERNLLVARDNARAGLDLVIDASTGNGSGVGGDSGLKSLSNGRNNMASFTLNLDVPIDNLGLQAAIVQAQVQLEQDKITLANTARQLKITLSNDLADVKSNYVQIGLAETTLKLQQQNQDFLKAKLKFGLVSTFEVTTKQQDLDNARVQLIQTKINYLNSLTQLYSDMGKTLDEWNIKVRF